MSRAKPAPTFEVRFVGKKLTPEAVSLRAVSEALAAVQDLATGRDRYELSHVPPEKSIRLVAVRRGSAVYGCLSQAADEACAHLTHVASLLSAPDSASPDDDGLAAALGPIESLSNVARSVECTIEISIPNRSATPLMTIDAGAFVQLSQRMLLTGDTTVVGRVERVGGATSMRCLLHVPGRRRGLYCDVESKEVVRRLGQHLYEDIAARGEATWLHRSWRIYRFRIRDFTQPKIGNSRKAIEKLRNAGLSAWDDIPDPEAFLRELRS